MSAGMRRNSLPLACWRLPTEVEWEVAAAAWPVGERPVLSAHKRRFPWDAAGAQPGQPRRRPGRLHPRCGLSAHELNEEQQKKGHRHIVQVAYIHDDVIYRNSSSDLPVDGVCRYTPTTALGPGSGRAGRNDRGRSP